MSILPEPKPEGHPQRPLNSKSYARVRRVDLISALTQMKHWIRLHPNLPRTADIRLEITDLALEIERPCHMDEAKVDNLKFSLPVDGPRAGCIVVEAAKLLRLCKSLDGEFISIGFDGPPVLRIQSENCRFEVSCSEDLAIAKPHAFDAIGSVKIKREDLKNPLKRVLCSMNTDRYRYGLHALHLELFSVDTEPSIKFVTTDGHRLTITWIGAPRTGKHHVLNMESYGAKMLMLFLGERETWELSWSKTEVCWKAEGACLRVCLLKEDAFPDYVNVVPSVDDCPNRLTFDRAAMMKSVRRSVALTSRHHTPMAIELHDGTIKLATCQNQESCLQNLFGTYDILLRPHQKWRIGINPTYLLETLKVHQQNEMLMRFDHRLSPIRIDDGDTTVILMPMRVDD